jgi:hypothetical protein
MAYQINKQDVYDVYSLEYKLHSILNELNNTTGYISSDSLYVYYLKIYHKLESVANKLIKELYDIFDDWLDYHVYEYGEEWIEEISPKKVFENMDRYTPSDGDLLNPDHERVQKYKGGEDIFTAFQMLMDAKKEEESLQNKIKAINFALHVCHSTGLMIQFEEFGYGGAAAQNVIEFFDRMSAGEDISQWNQEIRMRANSKFNWYKLAQKNIEWFYHGTTLSKAKKILSSGLKASYVGNDRKGLFVADSSDDAYSWALQLIHEGHLDGIPAVLEFEVDMDVFDIEQDPFANMTPDYADAYIIVPTTRKNTYQLQLFDPDEMNVPIEKISVLDIDLIFPTNEEEIAMAKDDVEMVHNREGLLP